MKKKVILTLILVLCLYINCSYSEGIVPSNRSKSFTEENRVSDTNKGSAMPDAMIQFGLHLEPQKASYQNGDNLKLQLDLQTPSTPTIATLIFVMLDVTQNKMYFAPTWGLTPNAVLWNFTLPPNVTMTKAPLLDIRLPIDNPPLNKAGNYIFAIAATKPTALDFISNIASISLTISDVSSLRIDVSDNSAPPGGSDVVKVSISGLTKDIYVFGFTFHFDGSIFNYVSISKGTLTQNFPYFGGNLNEDGTLVVYGIYGDNPIPSGSTGSVAEITLSVKSGAPLGTYENSLSDLVDDFDGAQTDSGNFTVRASE